MKKKKFKLGKFLYNHFSALHDKYYFLNCRISSFNNSSYETSFVFTNHIPLQHVARDPESIKAELCKSHRVLDEY